MSTSSNDTKDSAANVFDEPKITLDGLSPVPDVELHEDETTERLKAIILHMRKLAGRRETSGLFEFSPKDDGGGGVRFIATFPEGDELAMCRMMATEMRRQGFEDPTIHAKLDAAYDQVRRAQKAVDAVESMAAACGALAGDIFEAFDKFYAANEDGDVATAVDVVEQVRERLNSPPFLPFRQFVEACRADRAMHEARRQMDQLRDEQSGRRRRGVRRK
jgi:hypothetical protein